MTDEFRIMGIGLLGAGFSATSLRNGLAMKPDVIASDGGTSDKGPYFLGAGVADIRGIRRDLELLIPGARSVGAPLLFGSVGTAGGDAQVDTVTDIALAVARDLGIPLRVASLRSELDSGYLRKLVADGKVKPHTEVPELTADDIATSLRFVSMMGAEPFCEALDAGADVVIGGRAVDPAMFAAPMLNAGFDPGLAWHLGMAMDKGPMITVPTQAGSCIIAVTDGKDAVISPTRERVTCTPRSVSATLVYESADPNRSVFPSGTLDLSAARYEREDDRSVRIGGASWTSADRYTVKVEGVRYVGERAATMLGIRDPFLIADLDNFLESTCAVAARNLELLGIEPDTYQVRFRVYGRDGVMGALEPCRDQVSHEIGVMVEAVAESDDVAGVIVDRFAAIAHRVEFEHRLTTAGNTATPFSGPPLSGGPVYEWSAWHIAEPECWQDTCRIEYTDV